MSKQFVFVAVGGTGAKVAQALVTWLSIGLPLKRDDSRLKSSETSQDVLKIWRLDPDANSGSKDALARTVEDYHFLQKSLGMDPANPPGGALWGLRVEAPVTISPTDFAADSQVTLNSILNSLASPQAESVLRLFYSPADREQDISRGFYQKPFIGSAILANLSGKLEQTLRECSFEDEVRFFVCGSLFGGTGASGVPVLSNILMKDYAPKSAQRSWKIGGCVLGPYFKPPQPVHLTIPSGFPRTLREFLDAGHTQEEARRFVDEVQVLNADKGLTVEEVEQILGEYYAQEQEIVRRSASALTFYKRTAHEMFDRLYYLGLDPPTPYGEQTGVGWSNGGGKQRNPSHGIEYVAALASLDFFVRSDPTARTKDTPFEIPCSARPVDMGLSIDDLPLYGGDESVAVDARKWLLVAALGVQFYRFHLRLAALNDCRQLKGTSYRILEQRLGNDPEGFRIFKNQLEPFHRTLLEVMKRVTPYGADWERTLGWKEKDERGNAGWIQEFWKLVSEERPLVDGAGILGWKQTPPVGLSDHVKLQVGMKRDFMQLGSEQDLTRLGVDPRALERLSAHTYLSLMYHKLYFSGGWSVTHG